MGADAPRAYVQRPAPTDGAGFHGVGAAPVAPTGGGAGSKGTLVAATCAQKEVYAL